MNHVKLARRFRVEKPKRFRLRRFDPAETADFSKEAAERIVAKHAPRLTDLQERLYAENRWALLVILQGIDAAGKDGAIKHVMAGLNPQGCIVHPFKAPTADELDHDFLWRAVTRLPPRGDIGIFNRSYYEEVLVVRVHPENLERQKLPAESKRGDVWERRYREINDWERYLTDNGIKVVKLFLNLSKEEQRTRFLKRLDLPEKNWKFSSHDVKERERWDDYQTAFSQMLSHTSTSWAPWHVIPADHKWFARLAAAVVIGNALIEIDPQYPQVDAETRDQLAAARTDLVAQAPKGAEPDPFEAKLARDRVRAKKKQDAKDTEMVAAGLEPEGERK